ncbi:hypothetical protein DPMN_074030 [Dreissena polymorpha]|uniref:Uncharacterized protein n=1 Tax=Dreissena polymorpha TaxID=45954 RepID=A0A9D4BDQ0_DREPO|nr:hypothetical protein DPMN_074030 [Dreissena polymorpha]
MLSSPSVPSQTWFYPLIGTDAIADTRKSQPPCSAERPRGSSSSDCEKSAASRIAQLTNGCVFVGRLAARSLGRTSAAAATRLTCEQTVASWTTHRGDNTH